VPLVAIPPVEIKNGAPTQWRTMVVCYRYIFEKWFLQFLNFILLHILVAMSSYVQEKVLSLEVETEVTGTW
jgi:hypothetical protein